MTPISNCQVGVPLPPKSDLIARAANDPTTIPPGNQTWNLLSIVVLFLEYIVAIIGLHAASTAPLAKRSPAQTKSSVSMSWNPVVADMADTSATGPVSDNIRSMVWIA